MGNDGDANKDRPVAVVVADGSSTPLTGIVQVSAGTDHTCALTDAGGVLCWGGGNNGQLGNDGTAEKDHPVAVVDADGSSDPLTGIVQVSAGAWYNCALTGEGKVVCWGFGVNGQLGNDGTSTKDHPVAVVDGNGSSTPLTGIVQVSTGSGHTCALSESGGVFCWGDNSAGQLGNDGTGNTDHPVAVVDADGSSTALTGIVQISTGNFYTCALTDEGKVLCWGAGGEGRLGNGDTTNANVNHPVEVVVADGSSTPLTGIAQVNAGQGHTCALTDGGRVLCWGNNSEGGLGQGDGANTNTSHPVEVKDGNGSNTALGDIVEIYAGEHSSCALTSGGGVLCWGKGDNGRLGNDASADKDYPVTVVDAKTTGSDPLALGSIRREAPYCYKDGICQFTPPPPWEL